METTTTPTPNISTAIASNMMVQFDKLTAEINLRAAPMREVKVVDQESQNLATNYLKEVTGWRKNLEALRKNAIAPLLEKQREINAIASKMEEAIVKEELHLKGGLLNWSKQLEAKRKEEAARIEKERKEREAEALRQAELAKEEAAAASMFDAPEEGTRAELVIEATTERAVTQIAKEAKKEEKQMNATMKVSGVRTIWKFEVTDPTLVPKEFWQINEAAIGIKVRGGAREIPGVRIFEEQTIGAR